MIKKVYKYNKSVSKNYSKMFLQLLKIMGIGFVIAILLSLFNRGNVYLMIIPVIISTIIAFAIFISNLTDMGNVNCIYAVDDAKRIYIINAIVNPGTKTIAISRVTTLNENSNEIDFIESIVSKAKEYFPQVKNGILRNPDYSNPYIVKEILKVHSFNENDKSIIVKCDYTIINGTPENNKIIEISKSYNDWDELLEIIKTSKL